MDRRADLVGALHPAIPTRCSSAPSHRRSIARTIAARAGSDCRYSDGGASASRARPKSPTSWSIRATRTPSGSASRSTASIAAATTARPGPICQDGRQGTQPRCPRPRAQQLARIRSCWSTTPDGIWSSTDDGESLELHGFPRFAERDAISYCRGVAVKPDDPEHDLRRQRRLHPGQARRDSAHPRRRQDLGEVRSCRSSPTR